MLAELADKFCGAFRRELFPLLGHFSSTGIFTWLNVQPSSSILRLNVQLCGSAFSLNS